MSDNSKKNSIGGFIAGVAASAGGFLLYKNRKKVGQVLTKAKNSLLSNDNDDEDDTKADT